VGVARRAPRRHLLDQQPAGAIEVAVGAVLLRIV
jgi:hypothetical protein